jgi:hypothetical protein
VASIRRYVTQRGDRRWEARWRDAAGRDRSKVFHREGDAKRYRVDVERKQQLGPLYDAQRVLLGDFFVGWRERYEQRVRPATFERGMQAIKHLLPFMPLYLDQVTAPDVEDRIVGVRKGGATSGADRAGLAEADTPGRERTGPRRRRGGLPRQSPAVGGA